MTGIHGRNYGYTLFLIIATNSVSENEELYKDCISNPKLIWEKLFFIQNSELRQKMRDDSTALFPFGGLKRFKGEPEAGFHKLDTME